MLRDELFHLIERVRSCDQLAAKELVEYLYLTVIRIVRNHLPRHELEEDLSQEIFLKIFAKLGQYRADMPFEHWVSRIAVNTCIDHLRKQRNRPEYRWSDFSEQQQSLLNNFSQNATQLPKPSAEESRELLNCLMVSLKPDERAIVQWLYLEEKSVAEICNLTGWKPSKIKITAFRARQKLSAAVKRLEK